MTDTGVPMETALTKDGCSLVKGFLQALTTAHNKYKQVNVSEFLKQYAIVLNGRGVKPRKERKDKFWTDEKLEIAVSLKKSGLSWQGVADRMGTKATSIQTAVSAYRRYGK